MSRSNTASAFGATMSSSRRLARWARRWAPWKAVIAALLAVAALHALWALRIPWPTSSMTALADYRVLDITLYSPLCIWSALGIYYRKSPSDRTPIDSA